MKRIIILLFTAFLALNIQSAKAQTEVTFYTTEGNFIVMMYDSLMPITVGNFLDLVDTNFYDGIIFHRVIDNFIIQGGDPLGTGTGGPGYSIPDEFDSTGTLSNVIKTISMANSGPNSGGSQFFFNLRSNTYLDFDKAPLTSKHPVFGIVVHNWPIVQTIGKVAVNGSNRPLVNVVMDSIRVTPNTIGLNEVLANQQLHVYPNPVSENSQLYFERATGGEGEVIVYNNVGAVIYSKKIDLTSGTNSISLRDLSNKNLSAGAYNLVMKQGENLSSIKLILP